MFLVTTVNRIRNVVNISMDFYSHHFCIYGCLFTVDVLSTVNLSFSKQYVKFRLALFNVNNIIYHLISIALPLRMHGCSHNGTQFKQLVLCLLVR